MIQGKQRLLAIVLLTSVALNLFLGGIVVGKYIGQVSESKPGHPPHRMPRLRWMIQSLPEESREKIRPLLLEHRANIKFQKRRAREARRAVHQQLTASDFNPEALSKALEKLRQKMGEAQKVMHAVLVKMASQLDEEDRRRLSETTRPRRPPWLRKHDRGPKPEMPMHESP
jgi:uncharacterized membrane protein